MHELIDPADLRKVVVIHHGTGDVDVRLMTTEQADLTREGALLAHRGQPGTVCVRVIDVASEEGIAVRVTADAAADLVADARSRKAHPAL